MIDQEVSHDVLVHATRGIFEMMVFMGVEPLDPAQFEHEGGDSLLGTITFSGDLEGCFGFCCNDACAKAVAASMLGLDPSDEVAHRDVNDAIGEIVNMVMGSIKADSPTFQGVNVSIPTVIRARKIEQNQGEEGTGIVDYVKIGDEHKAELSLHWRQHVEKKE